MRTLNEKIILFYKLSMITIYVLINGVIPSDIEEFSGSQFDEVNNYLNNTNLVYSSGLINVDVVHRLRYFYNIFYNREIHNAYFKAPDGSLKNIYNIFDDVIRDVKKYIPNNDGFMFELSFDNMGVCRLLSWTSDKVSYKGISHVMSTMTSNDLIVLMASDQYFKNRNLKVIPYVVDGEKDIDITISVVENG